MSYNEAIIKGNMNEEVYAAHDQAFSVENIRTNLLKRPVWQVPHVKTIFQEDNDTSDEDTLEEKSDEFVMVSGYKIKASKVKGLKGGFKL